MTETIDDWEQAVITAAGDFSFVQAVQTIDKNPAALKMRLILEPDLFVQIYINVTTGTRNFVLILGRQRIYARDCVGGVWHQHPFDDPDAHDFSTGGARPASVTEFLAEVQELVERTDLL